MMMARYLDPKNDLTFKRIFGEHPDLLIHFLNALMPFEPGRYIEAIEYLPAEQVPDNPGKKNSIVDVKCKDNHRRQFIIEMQMDWDEIFMNRIVFNAGKAYVKQLTRGDAYHLLQPVYTLAIMNTAFDCKTEQFYHHYRIVNMSNTDETIPGLEFVLIELDKFFPATVAERKLMALWLRFLKEVNEGMTELPSELAANEQIRQAAELCRESAFTPEELAVYEKYWDMIRTDIAVRESVRLKSEAKGEARGRSEGRAEGLAEGFAKGRAERERLEAELKERERKETELAARIAELEQRISGKK
jgi:predicted transposase/invertase (TIGR01784 family)